MLYFIDNIDLYGEKLFNEVKAYVSAERLEYAYRYRFFPDRLQSVLVYVLLRAALYREYGIIAFPEIKKSKYGKPFLCEYPDIHFSLSHCRKGVACVVSSGNAGTDIQEYSDYNSSVADFFMCREEKERTETGDRKTEFTRIWTLKESFGKYTGRGICYDMKNMMIPENVFTDGCISESYLFKEFVLSVTAEEVMKPQRISLSELKEILSHCERLF